MSNILLVGAGGFLGATSRYLLGSWIRILWQGPFPLATLAVNFLGCVGIGMAFEFFREHPLLPTVVMFFIIGFLGSFTTFSTFSYETLALIKAGKMPLACLNTIASFALCMGGALAGERLGRLLHL